MSPASAADSSTEIENQGRVSCILKGSVIAFLQTAAGRGLCLSWKMAAEILGAGDDWSQGSWQLISHVSFQCLPSLTLLRRLQSATPSLCQSPGWVAVNENPVPWPLGTKVALSLAGYISPWCINTPFSLLDVMWVGIPSSRLQPSLESRPHSSQGDPTWSRDISLKPQPAPSKSWTSPSPNLAFPTSLQVLSALFGVKVSPSGSLQLVIQGDCSSI